jgi:hypothetical protein
MTVATDCAAAAPILQAAATRAGYAQGGDPTVYPTLIFASQVLAAIGAGAAVGTYQVLQYTAMINAISAAARASAAGGDGATAAQLNSIAGLIHSAAGV